MIMYFTVDSGAKIALENLLKSGLYRDASEAICVSLINHDIIQREAQHKGRVEISDDEFVDDRYPIVHGSNVRPPNFKHAKTTKHEVSRQTIPEIFRLPRSPVAVDQFPEVAEDPARNQLVGPKHWPFGQYNKLL